MHLRKQQRLDCPKCGLKNAWTYRISIVHKGVELVEVTVDFQSECFCQLDHDQRGELIRQATSLPGE